MPTLAGFPRSQKFLLGDRIQGIALDGLDHYCKEVLRVKGYVRYVDDFVLSMMMETSENAVQRSNFFS